ncbi:hypothetical protein GCM10028808_12130 [Spirosoma migulaei]
MIQLFYSIPTASHLRLIGTLFFLISLHLSANAQTVRYVSATGTNADPVTATSWPTATTNLQGAINASAIGDQVWVAVGTYNPTNSADRTISFSMKNNLAIYGGFPADGSGTLENRNPTNFPTILSGSGANNYHVIANNALNSTAVLDGIVITGGNANDFNVSNGYTGGGILNQSSSPTFINCIVKNNHGNTGGGIANYTSNPTFINCIIHNNTSLTAGGLCNISSNPTLINCVLANNVTSGRGSEIFNDAPSAPNLTNCIIWQGISSPPVPPITNLGPGRVKANYCLIRTGIPDNGLFYQGSHNIISSLFPFVSNTDFRLKDGSLAIDAGDNEAYNNAVGPQKDLYNNTRIQHETIDIGVYESTPGPDLTPILVLPQANFPAPGSVGDFLISLAEVAGLPTSLGLVNVTVTAPLGYTLTFDPTLTSMNVSGGTDNPVTVSNADWSVSSNLDNRQITVTLTTGQFIDANGQSALGFSITRTNANSGSSSIITVNVADDAAHNYDSNPTNNVYARAISSL